MPKVSVIIPVYNTEKFLRKCLDSVCNQTLQDIEIICINDCSTDGALEILREYARKDKRIKLIELFENGGAAKARNIGIDIAEGEYLGFVDSDDFVDLDFYEKLYTRAIKAEVEIAKGNYKNAENNEIDFALNEEIRKNKTSMAFAYCSAIYSNNLISKNNISFPDLIDMEDPIFSFKCAVLSNKIEIVDTAYINIVKRKNSVTSGIPTLEKIIDKLKGLELIIDYANSINVIKKESYIFVLTFWFLQTFNNSIVNKDFEIRAIIAETLYKLYDKIYYKKEVIQSINAKAYFLAENLQTRNINKFIHFDNDRQYLFSKLRGNVKRSLINA